MRRNIFTLSSYGGNTKFDGKMNNLPENFSFNVFLDLPGI